MAAQEKLRVVFDCNALLVAAAKETSAPAACLWLARSGYIRWYPFSSNHRTAFSRAFSIGFCGSPNSRTAFDES
jgi:hypothetical protein